MCGGRERARGELGLGIYLLALLIRARGSSEVRHYRFLLEAIVPNHKAVA
jgi:hypothetical protein